VIAGALCGDCESAGVADVEQTGGRWGEAATIA